MRLTPPFSQPARSGAGGKIVVITPHDPKLGASAVSVGGVIG
jgi:hypothetical protein